MPANKLCHKFFANALCKFNQARMKTLLHCADALISSDKLTLTDIGRHLRGKAHIKHKIKRVDRLLSNTYLQQQQVDIYQSIAREYVHSLPSLVVAVDWSGCCGSDYHLLRASLLVDGRSLPLYNMVVEEKDKETADTHSQFLDQLNKVLDGHANVYIISDGGFLTPFYSQVHALNWHFIGRLRGTMKCHLEHQPQSWQTLKQLHSGATSAPKSLGKARLGK